MKIEDSTGFDFVSSGEIKGGDRNIVAKIKAGAEIPPPLFMHTCGSFSTLFPFNFLFYDNYAHKNTMITWKSALFRTPLI